MTAYPKYNLLTSSSYCQNLSATSIKSSV